jgi:type IV pilus assembly protein PilC
MPDYNFTAHGKNGQLQRGTIAARDRESAIASLRSRELVPILVKEVKQSHGLNMEIPIPGAKRVKSKDLVIFTRQLATMVNAGVPILRSLALLKDQTESVSLRRVMDAVIADVQAGGNLSGALAKHPATFSTIYVNMVKAGEEGGILDKVLNNLAFQQEKDSALKGKIKGAMIYPSVIFTVTLIAFIILMTFIVPKIGSILTSLSNGKAKLPIYTRILLDISHVMRQPWFILTVVVGLPVALILFRRYIKTKKGRYQWHSLLLRMPLVKSIILKTAVARFSRTFASLMSAGVSIVESIETTAGAIGNAVIEKELLESSKAVQAGSPLSSELAKSKHFPPIVIQMLSVGEETGQTDSVILKVAEFYEEEVDTAVAAISSIIEPVMIILLGGMVGIIAISVFGPITQLSTSVSG